jgi:hypothetical protein
MLLLVLPHDGLDNLRLGDTNEWEPTVALSYRRMQGNQKQGQASIEVQ